MTGKIVYRCTRCEKVHEGLPAIAYDAPAHYYDLAEPERAAKANLTDDLCGIDGVGYFIRAVLEIPVIAHEEALEWGVGGSLSEANFERYRASFDDDDQDKLGPMFSWFASRLPGYPDTLNLKCNLVPRDGGQRPLVEFAPGDDHPLTLDWKNGIGLARAIEFVMPVLRTH